MQQLKAEGMFAEAPDGLLQASGSIEPAQQELLQLENADRTRVFQLVGERTGKDASEVATAFARMASAASVQKTPGPSASAASPAATPSDRPVAKGAENRGPTGAPAVGLKVLTRPFASLYNDAQPAAAKTRENLPAFSAYYVSEKAPGWYHVSNTAKGASAGWLKEEDVVEWKQNLVVEFTHPEGRQPVLMFNSKPPLEDLMSASKAERLPKVSELYAQIDHGELGPDFPIRTMEPRRAVKSHDQFYVLPIVNFEEATIDGREGRILQLAAAARQRGAVDLRSAENRASLTRPTDLRSAVAKGVKVDLVFVMDLTRSMGPFADRTLQMVRNISSQLGSDREVVEAVRFGFWGYRDFPELSKGIEYNTKNYTPELQRLPDFANTLNSVQETKIDSIDYPEDVFAGISDAVQQTAWRPGALRLIILVGDAPGRAPKEKDAACRGSNCPEGTKSGLDAESIRSLMDKASVYSTALYLNAPKWRQYAQLGETQFRVLARNPNDRPGEENFRVLNAADTTVYGAAADSLAKGIVDLILSSQGRGGDTGAGGTPTRSAQGEVNSTEGAEAAGRELARNMFRGAMVEWLGKADAAPVPRDVTVWASDKDLTDPTIQSLEVQLFVTKTELNTLKIVMDEVLNAGLRGRVSGEDFFKALQAVTTVAARDASRIREAATLAQTGLIPSFLEGLPYRSTLMDMNNDTWARMSPDAQDQLLRATESKLRFYQAVHDNAENWQALNQGDDRDNWVAAIPLEQLP